MAWLVLAMTIVLEVAGTTMMKLSAGFSAFWPSLAAFCFYICALVGIIFALKELDLSIAYAVWSGAGTALTTLVGITVFGEPAGLVKLLSIALVPAGVIGLHMAAVLQGR